MKGMMRKHWKGSVGALGLWSPYPACSRGWAQSLALQNKQKIPRESLRLLSSPPRQHSALTQMSHLHKALLASVRTTGWPGPARSGSHFLFEIPAVSLIGCVVSRKLLEPFLCPNFLTSKSGDNKLTLQSCSKNYLMYVNFPGPWEMFYQC